MKAGTEDPVALLEELSENDAGDGLPVIPPTAARVEEMLAASYREGDDLVMEIPTNFSELTVKKLAECAVMAGCRPNYFPVLLAGFEAMAEWDNLQAALSTTGGFWVSLVVNGPIREELDINCGAGLFGPGYRANATLGRAVSLAFIHVGGVYPGVGTMATHGHPGRYTFCFGEREEKTSWDPFHTDLADIDPETSAVTAITAHSPHLISEGSHEVPGPMDVVKSLGRGGAHPGAPACMTPGEVMFVIGPDHAGILDAEFTKDEVKELLYEHCRLPFSERALMRSPDDARIVVAGGVSNMSSVIHTFTFGGTYAQTKQIHTA